jgi:hypothetical protein
MVSLLKLMVYLLVATAMAAWDFSLHPDYSSTQKESI